MKYLKRGSRWAAAMTALGLALVGGFPGVANAKVVQCYDHGAYHGDSGGHGTSNGKSVTLNPFNPAWDTGTRWESLTLYGTDGRWFTQDLPTSGVFEAPGGVLTGWRVCKGEPDAVVTVAAPTTTAATSVSTPASVPVPVATPTTTTVVPGAPPEAAPPRITEQRLPETGRNSNLALGVAGAALAIGATLMWVRRRPA